MPYYIEHEDEGPFFKKTRLMFVSPWLLAAAVGLLSLIIVIFAANNIKRERGMLSEGLFRKGEAIIDLWRQVCAPP